LLTAALQPSDFIPAGKLHHVFDTFAVEHSGLGTVDACQTPIRPGIATI
jgi:hypothetical protein